ncbi:MAG: cupin [Rhodobacteraceae bacterium]|nr:cupin [Paracoccaceae bacterium]
MSSDNAEPHLLYFDTNGAVPNNPSLPVIVFRSAFRPKTEESVVADNFRRNGWGGAWAWRIFDRHHYHLTAHEALVVTSGAADLMLGGPGQQAVHISAGDAIVLPAGTGHCRIAVTGNFRACGAYAPGQDKPDVVAARGAAPRPGHRDAIARLPLPSSDPPFGIDGPLASHWRCHAVA